VTERDDKGRFAAFGRKDADPLQQAVAAHRRAKQNEFTVTVPAPEVPMEILTQLADRKERDRKWMERILTHGTKEDER
jgi:hypothetical protein